MGESNCKAKIRELDFSLRVQKNVVTLDISMESVVGVEVDEGLQHVLAHVGDVLFIPLDGWEQEVGEGACVHQLHCNLLDGAHREHIPTAGPSTGNSHRFGRYWGGWKFSEVRARS